MKGISCVMLATNKRLEWLKMSIESIESTNFKFEKKILSIDHVTNIQMSENDINFFSSLGWIVDLVFLKSKHLSLQNALSMVNSDYVFYCEDDIVINKIPNDIFDIIGKKINNKSIGILSMNLGGSTLDYPKNLGDLPQWEKNIIHESDSLIYFLRDDTLASKWFVEFPSTFFDTDLLKKLLNSERIPNNQIEEILTKNFFNHGYNTEYFKVSFCNKKIKDYIKILINDDKIRYWNEKLESYKLYMLLDQNQGGAQINLNKINYVQ